MGYLSTTPVDLTTAWVQIAAANEPVLFQRVSGYDVIYQIAEDEPDEESTDGHRLNDYKPVGFTASNPVWVRSVGDSVLQVSVGNIGTNMGYHSTSRVDLTPEWVQISAANEPVLFERVSGYDVIYQIAEDEPEVENTNGHRLNGYKPASFTASNPVWARSVGDSVLQVSVGNPELPVANGGGKYLGELSLTPTYSYYNVQDYDFLGCNGVTNVDGSVTVTPDNPLISIPNISNGNGFIATIKSLTLPQLQSAEMSFVWPDLLLDVEGGTSFSLIIYNSSVSDEDLVAGFQSSPSVTILATVLTVDMYNGDVSNVYSFNKINQGDPVNYKDFTLPTAGDKLYLTLSPDGNIAIDYQFLSAFPLRYLPEGENLSVAFMYSTGKEVTALTSFELDFTPRIGNQSFMQIAEAIPVTIPNEANDGDIFKCTGGGKIGDTLVHASDSFILTNNKTDCIVLLSENTISNLTNKAVRAAIEAYSSSIGLGIYAPYFTVQGGANAEISAQLQSGGIIDQAIQAVLNP